MATPDPQPQHSEFALARLLWCVRTTGYLATVKRSDELLSKSLGGDLVAFVAETLPGSWMRGVPREDWSETHTDVAISGAADANTASRFGELVARIEATERIPADGWKLSSDGLFQGSVLLLPEVLQAFVARAQCDVLLANPDRSQLLVVPITAPSADRFAMRAAREWREAMNPVSREVLISDGSTIQLVGRKRSRLDLLPWLAN